MKSRNFVYYQPNKADLKDKYGDCCVRAISKVLDISWIDAFNMLVEKARQFQCMPNGKPAYEAVLLDNGFVYHGISNRKGTKRPLVKQFARDLQGRAVARTAHHLTACVDGKFYDTWDSGEKSMYGYWSKE
jgi:hypothetical protein